MGSENTKQSEYESNEDIITDSKPRHSKQEQPPAKFRQSKGYISPVLNTRKLPPPESPPILNTIKPLSPPPPPPPPQIPATPVVVKRNVYLPPQTELIPPKKIDAPAASTFEKAPLVALNYVAKSSDNKSPHLYEMNTITIVRRTSSQSVQHGNRWYNYDYDTNTKASVQ